MLALMMLNNEADAEKSAYSDSQSKKSNNEQFVETDQPNALVISQDEEFYSDPRFNYDYKGEVMSYPLDMNTSQDHFKIMKYNYQRKDINASSKNA